MGEMDPDSSGPPSASARRWRVAAWIAGAALVALIAWFSGHEPDRGGTESPDRSIQPERSGPTERAQTTRDLRFCGSSGELTIARRFVKVRWNPGPPPRDFQVLFHPRNGDMEMRPAGYGETQSFRDGNFTLAITLSPGRFDCIGVRVASSPGN